MESKKALEEKLNGLKAERAGYIAKMEGIAKKAEEESRAVTEEELNEVNTQKNNVSETDVKIKALEDTISLLEDIRNNYKKDPEEGEGEGTEGMHRGIEGQEEKKQIRAFVSLIKGEQVRAGELTVEGGKVLVPKTIADKIITKVKELSPIYEKATKYKSKGTISVPVYNSESGPKMAYAEEFTSLASTTGKFTSVDLNGFLAGCLCLVSKSLINNTDNDIVEFIVNETAKAAAFFIEGECLNGTDSKVTGLKNVAAKITGEVNLDNLIALQNEVISAYQKDAIWIVSKPNSLKIKQLKDANGRPLLNPDPTSPFGWKLLGNNFYVSENCKDTDIWYGDMSGLSVKMAEESEIEILRERYADMHAIGVIDWIEIDAKVTDEQKIARMTVQAAKSEPEEELDRLKAATAENGEKKQEVGADNL